MEPCGGTGARSVGTVYVNEWAGFFEKSGSGTVSTGNRWWCHGAGVPPAVPAPMWRSGGDVMHAPGRDVMHWYSINVVAAKCFFETIFFANQFTIFRIFKDSNFKRKFWTYYFFNNPTFRTVQIGLHLFRRSCPPLGPRAASSFDSDSGDKANSSKNKYFSSNSRRFLFVNFSLFSVKRKYLGNNRNETHRL